MILCRYEWNRNCTVSYCQDCTVQYRFYKINATSATPSSTIEWGSSPLLSTDRKRYFRSLWKCESIIFGSHLPKWLPSSLVHSMFIPKLDCTGTLRLNAMKWECVEDALREFAFPLFPTHQLYFCIIETWLIFKLIYFNSSFFHMTPKKV